MSTPPFPATFPFTVSHTHTHTHTKNRLFESCKDSFFEKDGECQRPSELYTSAEEFAKLFGVRASDNTKCFSDTDYDSIKPSGLLPFSLRAI